MLLATVVDTDALIKTAVAALVAGVGVTLIFNIALYAAARTLDTRRDGHTGAAVAFAVLAVVALLAFAGSVAVGIIVMTNK